MGRSALLTAESSQNLQGTCPSLPDNLEKLLELKRTVPLDYHAIKMKYIAKHILKIIV